MKGSKQDIKDAIDIMDVIMANPQYMEEIKKIMQNSKLSEA